MFIAVTYCSLQQAKRVRVICTKTPRENGGIWQEHCPICPLKKGAMGAEVPFYDTIIGKFMVYQDQLEINLFQLFGRPNNSE